jgi:hypothetical protein
MSIPYPQLERRRQSSSTHPRREIESSHEDSDNEEEDAFAILSKNFGRLMKNDKFKKKFVKSLRKVLKEGEPEEAKKNDPRVPIALNAPALGTCKQIEGISSRPRGKPTTLLSANLKKRRPQIRIKSFWPS